MAELKAWSARDPIAARDAATEATPLAAPWVTAQSEVQQFKTNTHQVQVPQGALILIPLCFAGAWAIAVAISGMPKAPRQRRLSPKVYSKIPCRDCQFYSNNPYVRCAIRPADAMTEQAIDCSDYSARE